MIFTPNLTRDIFDHALRSARETTLPQASTRLNADLLASIRGRLEEAWDLVTDTLNQAFIYGRAQAEVALRDSLEQIKKLLEEAGTQARDLHAMLLARMRQFTQDVLAGVLATVPSTAKIGDIPLRIAKMTFAQKIKLSGSIEANLTKLAELVSEGEMEVSCEYERDSTTL